MVKTSIHRHTLLGYIRSVAVPASLLQALCTSSSCDCSSGSSVQTGRVTSLLQHTDLAGLRAGKRNLQDRSDDHQSQVKQMVSLLVCCVISSHTAGSPLSLHH